MVDREGSDEDKAFFEALNVTGSGEKGWDGEIEGLSQPRRGAKYRASAITFDGLVTWLQDAIDEILSVETIVERVIVYSHQINLSAWENADGTLHANGYIGDASTRTVD